MAASLTLHRGGGTHGGRTGERVLVQLCQLVDEFLSAALDDIPADDPLRDTLEGLGARYAEMARAVA